MKSRAARLALLILFVVALGVTASLFWMAGSRAAAETEAARAFDARTRVATRLVHDLRAAQQAYVAAGQGSDYWSNKVAAGMDGLRGVLTALRAAAASPEAQSEIDGATPLLNDFAQLDRRAREYARSGQNLLASDLIFGDGLERTEAIGRTIEAARTAELTSRDAAVQIFQRRQMFAAASAAAASLLVVLLLLPTRAADPLPVPAVDRGPVLSLVHPQPAGLDFDLEGWSPPRRASSDVDAAEPAAQTTESSESSLPPPAETVPTPAPPPMPSTDFSGLASLCSELARIVDTRALPPLLDRAATVLDASGIIVWIGDPEGRELNPIVAQGYAPQLVSRLGAIPRDAENATAAAFRTSLLQTVRADAFSHGAIAAPLVTPSGCVGVMAAEVRNGGEQQDPKLAAATIVAAQLATLIGPPAAQPQNAEAAGA